MRRTPIPELLCIVAIAVVGSTTARADTFEVSKGSELSFLAKITASSFVARSDALSGTLSYDGANWVESAKISVAADSFETGMNMRDKHMRNKYLEAKKYAEILFEVGAIEVAGGSAGQSTVKGTLTIKGKKKPAEMRVKIVEKSDNRLVLSSEFPINITDFGIPQPKFAVVKMETTIQVTLKLVLVAKN